MAAKKQKGDMASQSLEEEYPAEQQTEHPAERPSRQPLTEQCLQGGISSEAVASVVVKDELGNRTEIVYNIVPNQDWSAEDSDDEEIKQEPVWNSDHEQLEAKECPDEQTACETFTRTFQSENKDRIGKRSIGYDARQIEHGISEGNAVTELSDKCKGKAKRCSICRKLFSQEEYLEKHMKTFHSGGSGEIPQPSKGGILDKVSNKNEGNHLRCSICRKLFSQEEYLEKHMKRFHSVKRDGISTGSVGHAALQEGSHFIEGKSNAEKESGKDYEGRSRRCSFCGALYPKAYLERHIKQFHGEKPIRIPVKEPVAEKLYGCTMCDKQYKKKGSLLNHMMFGHREKRRLLCSACGKTFGRREHLENHMRIHSGEKPYRCSVCGKNYRQRGSLDTHVKSHGERLYGCNLCGKRFTVRNVLKLHMRIHTGERPYECSVCGKKFAHKPTLAQHTKMHTGEWLSGDDLVIRPKCHLCSACGKSFTSKQCLLVHTRIHSGEKPFECSTCGKKFGVKSSLKTHMLLHSGEKPHGCSTCGLKFRHKQLLNRHAKLHHGVKPSGRIQSGEKPHGCSVCEKKFRTTGLLNGHVKIHSGEKPYGCSVCGQKFSQQDDLNEHTRTDCGGQLIAHSTSDTNIIGTDQVCIDIANDTNIANDTDITQEALKCIVCRGGSRIL